MNRVTLHSDRRHGRAGAWVIVIDGRPVQSGERASMIELLSDIMLELENVTQSSCKYCNRSA